MSRPSRTVAIWGSCVTRDAFALDSRAAELATRLPLLYYAARSSWISQHSPPWSARDTELAGPVSSWVRRAIEDDVRKTLVDRLVERQPDVVVLDLMDERLEIRRIGRTWFTVSNYLTQTAFGARALAEAEDTCSVHDPRRQALFAAAARALADRLHRELPRTTFVLHEAPYVTHTVDGIPLTEAQAAGADALNAAQRQMIDALADALGPGARCVTPRRRCASPTRRTAGGSPATTTSRRTIGGWSTRCSQSRRVATVRRSAGVHARRRAARAGRQSAVSVWSAPISAALRAAMGTEAPYAEYRTTCSPTPRRSSGPSAVGRLDDHGYEGGSDLQPAAIVYPCLAPPLGRRGSRLPCRRGCSARRGTARD